ncbi:MAG: serine hydrolase domain-containing protein [Candidatus Methylumidiphilus sp.]
MIYFACLHISILPEGFGTPILGFTFGDDFAKGVGSSGQAAEILTIFNRDYHMLRLSRVSSVLLCSIAGCAHNPTLTQTPPAAPAAAAASNSGLPPQVCHAPAPPPASPSEIPKTNSNVLPHRPFPATWQKVLDSFIANGSVPGAVVIVKSPEWGVRVGTAGVSNLADKTPVSPSTQFRVGSVTKTFIGQVILRLEQEGKIKLTDHVLDYLGDNPLVAGIPDIEKVTVADLLQMKSGIANYLGAPDIGYAGQLTPDRHFDADDLISVISKNGTSAQPHPCPDTTGQHLLPLCPDFAPGATYPNPYWVAVLNKQPPPPPEPTYPAWAYSNSNYVLLGMIAEKITGLKVEEALKRYVFDVAGLEDTYFATDNQHLPAMHGYTKYGAIPYPQPAFKDWCDVTATNPTSAWTAGAVVSTPWDLLKFEDAMFAKDTLLNSGTKNKWLTFVSADNHIGWEPMQYGVGGLMQPERSYGTARGHGGAYPGYKTLLYYFYDQQISFVLASNTSDNEYEANMLDTIMPLVSSAVTTPQAKPHARGKVRLAWQAGRVYGDSYNVYWGTDADKVDRADESSHEGVGFKTVSGVAAEVEATPGKTYYWRVDTVAPRAPLPLVNGPLWQFKAR